ncbi:MAG TPA: hypothetical protein VJP80_04965 [Candidatus Saccharimonadales bacterium]|nr:hypothetical protein [Candidatus Saccharimonadales bacterium]
MTYESIGFHGPADDKRRQMPLEVARQIVDSLETTPLADAERLDVLVQGLAQPTRLDGWETTMSLVDSLRQEGAYHLYWGDHGLLRPCLGTEHAAAVFDGSEIDYLPTFYDHPEPAPPEVLQIKRLADLWQDDGKVLSVALTGDNFSQAYFNRLVTANLLQSTHLREPVKQATALLADLNVIGGILQGQDMSGELASFQTAWPEEFVDYRDDLMIASYLSDASAHSASRLARNARNGFAEPAVRPDDAQLTFLFARHRNGALTLTPDRCELLLEQFPGVNRLRHLLDDSPAPYAREDEVFSEVVARQLATRRRPNEEVQILDEDDLRTDVVSFVQNDSHGGHVRVNRYVQGYPPDISTEIMYWLPGDGRLWQRSVYVGNLALGFEAGDYLGANPASYQHSDPSIEAMQRNITQAKPVEDNSIGRPLSVAGAWEVINMLQGYTE